MNYILTRVRVETTALIGKIVYIATFPQFLVPVMAVLYTGSANITGNANRY